MAGRRRTTACGPTRSVLAEGLGTGLLDREHSNPVGTHNVMTDPPGASDGNTVGGEVLVIAGVDLHFTVCRNHGGLVDHKPGKRGDRQADGYGQPEQPRLSVIRA